MAAAPHHAASRLIGPMQCSARIPVDPGLGGCAEQQPFRAEIFIDTQANEYQSRRRKFANCFRAIHRKRPSRPGAIMTKWKAGPGREPLACGRSVTPSRFVIRRFYAMNSWPCYAGTAPLWYLPTPQGCGPMPRMSPPISFIFDCTARSNFTPAATAIENWPGGPNGFTSGNPAENPPILSVAASRHGGPRVAMRISISTTMPRCMRRSMRCGWSCC